MGKFHVSRFFLNDIFSSSLIMQKIKLNICIVSKTIAVELGVANLDK